MLTALAIVLPAIFLCSIVGGYVLNKDYLYSLAESKAKLAQSKANMSTFSNKNETDIRPIAPIILEENTKRISTEHMERALKELADYTRNIKPNWIVGIHPGGRILSVIIADMVGIPSHKCLFISTSYSRSDFFQFIPHNPKPNQPIEGKVLFIDDITRSGKTLTQIKRRLHMQNFQWRHTERDIDEGGYVFRMRKAYFAVLLAVTNRENAQGSSFRPDWLYCRTNLDDFRLPWGELSHRIGVAYAEFRSGAREVDQEAIEIHEKISSDYDYALEYAKSVLKENDVKLENVYNSDTI